MTPRQTAVNTIVILLVVLIAWALIQVRSMLLLLVIGILFAAAIESPVNYLRRRGLKRGQAILAIYAGILTTLIVAGLLLVPTIADQSGELIDNIPNIIDNARDRAQQIDNSTIRDAAIRAIDEIDRKYNDSEASGESAFGSDEVIGLITTVGGLLVTIVTVFVVAFYWLTEKSIIKQVLMRKIPLNQRERAFKVFEDIEARIGGWTRGQMLLCLIIGVISTATYLILDVKYWIALGLFAGITELIPFIGPIIGGAAAAAVALTDSWQKALIVVIFVVILQQVESALLVPRVMRNAVGMSPLTVVLAVLFGSTLAGPLGAILAIPMGAAIQAIIQEVIRDQTEHAKPEPAATSGSG